MSLLDEQKILTEEQIPQEILDELNLEFDGLIVELTEDTEGSSIRMSKYKPMTEEIESIAMLDPADMSTVYRDAKIGTHYLLRIQKLGSQAILKHVLEFRTHEQL